jgi:WhiB family redox-sensing transcriptional regulator
MICQACSVLDECRTYARDHREYGFWGGESEEDRVLAGYAVPWPIGVRRRSVATAS